MNPTRPGHRRTRSLDLTDSLERLEAQHQQRQQFIKARAKFIRTQAPQTVKALLSVSDNGKNDADNVLISTEKLLFVPQTDEVDAANTLSSTTKMSLSVSSYDANTLPLTHQRPRSITPISELIQRFTSEMLNSETSSPQPQSQTSMKKSLEFKTNDDTQYSWKSTAGSPPQPPTVLSSAFQADMSRDDTVKQTTLSAPLKPLNLVKPAETSVHHGVILRRPSDFFKLENQEINSGGPLLQQSLMTDTVASNRATSLHMPPSSNVDSGVLVTIKRTSQAVTKAIPFRPPNWVKLPDTSTDQTDSAPSWAPLSRSSVTVTESSTQSTVAQPHMTRASSFQSNVAPPVLTRASFQSNVARPVLTRASSLQSYPVTEGSTSSEAPASSLLFSGSRDQRTSNLTREQNSSEIIARQSIQYNRAPDITLSSCKPSTSSENFIPNRESPNNREFNTSRLHSNVKFPSRSSTSSLVSLPRRSQMPSISVKSLIKKFSANN